MKKPIVETEIVDELPEICGGGHLEVKHGEICLRRCDERELLTIGKYRVTRTWIRPGKQPFDQKLYGAPRVND